MLASPSIGRHNPGSPGSLDACYEAELCQSLLDWTTPGYRVVYRAPDERYLAGEAVAGREYDVWEGGHPQSCALEASECAIRNTGHTAPHLPYEVLSQSTREARSLVLLLAGPACETYVRAVRWLRPPVKAQAAIPAAPGVHHPRTPSSHNTRSDFAAILP